MEMMISLYNVLLYLQLQLHILSQTYLLVQRRRRALYLLCLSDGKKNAKTPVQTVLGAAFQEKKQLTFVLLV